MKEILSRSTAQRMCGVLLILVLLFSFLLPLSANGEAEPPQIILYTCYRQLGWGDRVQLGYVDRNGSVWAMEGFDSELHWPYRAEEQLRFLAENDFTELGTLSQSDLFDLNSLIAAVEVGDGVSHPAANDAGTERTYAVRYDRDGTAVPILLGMSGDDCYENMDPNAQALYLAMRRLFPNVISYFGIEGMGPWGFVPVPITTFCGLGSLDNVTVVGTLIDCEEGPIDLDLDRKQQQLILNFVKNGQVCGKVSATDITGGYKVYSFYDQKQTLLGSVSLYDGLLYCSDGMYAIDSK